MKRNLSLFLFLLPFWMQAQVIDHFSDGNFPLNPIWNGTTDRFTINAETLQLSYDPLLLTGNQAYLSTVSEATLNGKWEITAKIQTTTSSSNYVRFYLTANNSNFTSPLNGYFVLIGNTNDEICLYRQEGTKQTKLIDGIDKRVDFPSFTVYIKVENDKFGNWKLFSKINNETDFTLEGNCNDNVIKKSFFAGLFVNYSTGNIGKYFFDDIIISGEKIIDNENPFVSEIEILAADKIKIYFSEEILTDNAQINLPNTSILNSKWEEEKSLTIQFESFMEQGINHYLQFNNVTDLSKNALTDDNHSFYVPKLKDILFNEIYADYEPQVNLPKGKFIELYNRSTSSIELKNWILGIGKSKYKLTPYQLRPNEYIIICAEKDKPDFQKYGFVLPVQSLSQLNITSSLLTLYSTSETFIDWIEYKNSWFDKNDFKKDGGWSLERIDTENFFPGKLNWDTSINPNGGTPGIINSIAGKNPDTTIPFVETLSILSDDSIRIQFSKEMEQQSIAETQHFVMLNNSVDSIRILQPQSNTIILKLADALQNETDSLKINNLKDASGNRLSDCQFKVAKPKIPADYQDIIINELLFNPTDHGTDYVELYNGSKNVWDLSEIYITNKKEGALQKKISITEQHELLFPNAYVVLTQDPEWVCQQYNCPEEKLFKTITLPTLPDAEGNIVILSKNGSIFDEFSYSEKMHHPFIKNKEGVSLERINPSFITQNADNWHSAASDAGYGTPGRKNSQFYDATKEAETKKRFWIQGRSFSPDNDGYKDLLEINYKMPENGYSASVSIYTANGFKVKYLYNNVLLSNEGTLFWDGTSENKSVCNSGVYILHIEYQHPNGKSNQEKIICALTSN